MGIKNHILFQFSVITFTVTLLVSLITGIWIGNLNRDNLIKSHIEMFPLLIEHMIEGDPETANYFLTNRLSEIPARIQDHMDMILKMDTVFKIIMVDNRGRILWSDRKSMIGQYHDINLNESILKPIHYTVVKNEVFNDKHYSASGRGDIFDIRFPVLYNSEKIGAVEIFASDSALLEKTRTIVAKNRIIMFLAGITIYVLLFSLYAKSYRNQKRITEQVKKTENVTIFALAYQAGLRDEETGKHLKRTQKYVKIIAEALSRQKLFKQYLSDSYIEDLVKSAPLHDIGKVGIEDNILKKPGKLTEKEFERIREHCELGAKILEEALKEVSFRSFLNIAIQLVRHHHEKWDGTGYPDRLKGNDIPLSARIMALCDVYDALRSKRYYKDAFSHEKSVKIIKEGTGTQFDPAIVEVFLEKENLFRTISETMAD